ncbi:hypothetical protein KUTeg_024938 [Tegillarca granosa]|uniref:Uncharacterized protein n=1 Tax=Tegillarca granosa TaxID=220873 RepID=A0ABQ9E4A7_TEGGR|nr:hypothetical protein KUTeg_024938 [Tegillarca granosa]
MDTLPELQEKYKVLLPPSQKSKRYSITELKTDVGRRPSISSITGSRRPSNSTPGKRFKSIGSRVTNMLKVKMAFQKKDGTQQEDNSPFIKITELPKEPRFCSTLSPEAQFAIMKGYEDTVYAYISKTYPEYKFLLRRSRTPKSISKCNVETSPDYRSFSSVNKDSADCDGFGEEDETDSVQRPSGLKIQRSLTNSPLSSTSRKNRLKSSTYDNRLNNTLGLSRSNSLPVLVPRERQLITTYRLQSIMDILDTVRSKMGQHALSPRIKKYPDEIKPVTDFNKWTTVWSKEFLDKQITGK